MIDGLMVEVEGEVGVEVGSDMAEWWDWGRRKRGEGGELESRLL